MPSFLSLAIATVVALLAVAFAFMHASKGEVPFDPPSYMAVLQEPPTQLHNGAEYTFGRFNAPVLDPNLRHMNFLENVFQRKEWSFNAVSDGRWLLGFAAVDLGYVESGFIYFFDSRTGSHDSWQFLLPATPSVTNGAQIASSDVQDGTCSKFATYISQLHVEICFIAQRNGWRMDVRAKTKRNCKVALQVDMLRSGSEFAMNYPIGPDRAGYTHKTAGLAVNGTLTFVPSNRVKAEHQLNQVLVNAPFNGVGLSDYTRSQSRRYTEWFWVALTYSNTLPAEEGESGREERYGLQFSTNTVGSLESMVWVDGQMFEIASPLTVHFVNMTSNHSIAILPGQLPLTPAPKTKYVITSEDRNVQLEYFVRGVLPNEISTPLAYGSFYHSYGMYRGFVKVEGSSGGGLFLTKPVPGIFEDHSVHW